MKEEYLEILLSQEPGGIIIEARSKFLKHDEFLLTINANERSITHRLGIYLQELYPEWHVDCEYNRDDHNPKELELPNLKPKKK